MGRDRQGAGELHVESVAGPLPAGHGPIGWFVARDVFKPFAGLTDIVPAALGEEVVVHGALALARQKLSS